MKYKPMLAKLGTKEILKRKDFIFEPKLDGTRVLVYKKGKIISLINRRNHEITYRYPEFLDLYKNIMAKNCVLDGEIVVLNKHGIPDFNLLQQREQLENKFLIELRSKKFPATLFVFDILEIEGKKLLKLPLIKRKEVLEKIIENSPFITICPYTQDGESLWKEIKKQKMEGIIAKKIDSWYVQKRSDCWIKIKNFNTIDAVVIGFTEEKRKPFSALLLAARKNGKWIYIGKVGTGFNKKTFVELKKEIEKLEVKRPLIPIPKDKIRGFVHWIRPKIVIEIKYLEITRNKEVRAPVFLRVRFDKKPEDCYIEF